MAPSDKELWRFRHLVFEASLPSDSSGSWLGLMGLLRPRASSSQESIMEWFVCPKDKLIGKSLLTRCPYTLRLMGLTWDWIQE
jgi:hypothetical protein